MEQPVGTSHRNRDSGRWHWLVKPRAVNEARAADILLRRQT